MLFLFWRLNSLYLLNYKDNTHELLIGKGTTHTGSLEAIFNSSNNFLIGSFQLFQKFHNILTQNPLNIFILNIILASSFQKRMTRLDKLRDQ